MVILVNDKFSNPSFYIIKNNHLQYMPSRYLLSGIKVFFKSLIIHSKIKVLKKCNIHCKLFNIDLEFIGFFYVKNIFKLTL